MKYAKGDGPVSTTYAIGGPGDTSRSRFMKTADTFRTDIQRTDYEKKSPGGEQSKTTGDSKSLPAIKPRT
jgi:hypothetical protein